jgi:CRISPR-associated protein Cas5/CasD subtype I-E
MGVRIDAPGVRWWDYHTVGAKMDMRIAEGDGKTKRGAMLTRREYLCDASFLVALHGEPGLIDELNAALHNPQGTLYLGRKSCPLCRPLLEYPAGAFPNAASALASVPWRRRLKEDHVPQTVDCLLDWEPTPEQAEAPADALVWYDVPLTFEPPSHRPRFVMRHQLRVGAEGEVSVAERPAQNHTPRPLRPRADYGNTEYRKRRQQRLDSDRGLCVFCKSVARTAQHVTYRRAGGNETPDDLRSLCWLCHDAVTMIEYGLDMGMDRINPEDCRWREQIIAKREEIIRFRSLETRRRRLSPEEVE